MRYMNCVPWLFYWLHLTTRVTSEKLFKSFQPPFFILKTHKHRNIHENPVLLTNKVHWSIHTESTCSFHSRWADKSEPAILEWSRLHLPLSTYWRRQNIDMSDGTGTTSENQRNTLTTWTASRRKLIFNQCYQPESSVSILLKLIDIAARK